MKARVIVSMACNRKCDNCCNKGRVIAQAEKLDNIDPLLFYDEIILTGGEPMLISNQVAIFLHDLRRNHVYFGKIYLYTALYNRKLELEYMDLFNYIDGLHYTVHYESTDQEVAELKLLSEMLPRKSKISFRLSIDNRLYEKYDFSNIDLSGWSIVRKLKWLDECQLPENEKLFLYDLTEYEYEHM